MPTELRCRCHPRRFEPGERVALANSAGYADEEGTVVAFGPDYDEPTYRVQLETGPLIPEVLESSLVPVSASSRSRAHLRRQWTHIGYGPSGNERGY